MIKICPQCHKEFEAKENCRKYCSYSCNNKSRLNRVARVCLHCGKEFLTRLSAKRKYCSQSCAHIGKRIIRFCKVCEKEIIQKSKKKNTYYCSNVCMGISQRATADVNCLTCGKSLRELKTIMKKKFTFYKGRKFCSFACVRKYKGETSIERIMREYLDMNNIKYLLKEQIGRYEVDFLLSGKVIIECDGDYWHNEKSKAQARKSKREAYLKSQGYTILYFTEKELKISNKWASRIPE